MAFYQVRHSLAAAKCRCPRMEMYDEVLLSSKKTGEGDCYDTESIQF